MSGYRSAIHNVLERLDNGWSIIYKDELESILMEMERRLKKVLLYEDRIRELEAFILPCQNKKN